MRALVANTGEGGCGPDAIKIPDGSNGGDKTSCSSPTVTTIPTLDLYCGGTLNCVTAAENPSTIITSVYPDYLKRILNICLSW